MVIMMIIVVSMGIMVVVLSGPLNGERKSGHHSDAAR